MSPVCSVAAESNWSPLEVLLLLLCERRDLSVCESSLRFGSFHAASVWYSVTTAALTCRGMSAPPLGVSCGGTGADIWSDCDLQNLEVGLLNVSLELLLSCFCSLPGHAVLGSAVGFGGWVFCLQQWWVERPFSFPALRIRMFCLTCCCLGITHKMFFPLPKKAVFSAWTWAAGESEGKIQVREKESASGKTAKSKRNASNRMWTSATPPSNVGWVKAPKHNLPVMHNLSLLLLLVRT